MRRYKRRSRRWKRIWRGDGVLGGGSNLENGMQPDVPCSEIKRTMPFFYLSCELRNDYLSKLKLWIVS